MSRQWKGEDGVLDSQEFHLFQNLAQCLEHGRVNKYLSDEWMKRHAKEIQMALVEHWPQELKQVKFLTKYVAMK